MLTHPLAPKLKELKLSGMLNTLNARVELAQSQQLSPLEFLALLLEDEIDRRHQHVLERREREAGFERPKRLSQFDFAALPTLDRAFVLRQASCEFIARQENWLLYGPTGVGKAQPSQCPFGLPGFPGKHRRSWARSSSSARIR
ncbi:MAG TPA: ATP-binding protein [Armatimonadota bacterium]|jgi:DNA replication protein DnaC